MLSKIVNFFKLDRTTLIVLAVILSFKSFAYNPSFVPTGSMIPTIQDKSFILVDVHSYGIKVPFTKITIFENGSPERGDIAVFRMPLDEKVNYVKRIVALPGDHIYFNDDEYFINKKPSDLIKFKDTVVPADHYFAIGDNIHHSYDSRFWGFIPKENLVGKYVYTLLNVKPLLPESSPST